MEITESQFEKIKHVLPRPRGNVKHDPLTQLNGMLYVLENGCKWRALPERYGPWNTVYRRWERWSKKGVMAAIFKELRELGVVGGQGETVSLDSTVVKVHPDGTGALKKTVRKASASRAGDGRRRSTRSRRTPARR